MNRVNPEWNQRVFGFPLLRNLGVAHISAEAGLELCG
jgi:hypothetical protein